MARNVLHDLRHLMPARPLRPSDAVLVAELQANKLLRSQGIEGPPVPASLISKFPRVEVETVYSLGVSGATAWSDGRWQILLNGGEPEVRQRFSAAHELKHVIDHPLVDVAYPAVFGMTSHQRQEQAANYFAACLLMPRRWVRKAWEDGVQDVDELARMFDVSHSAMRIRLKCLGLVESTKRCEVGAWSK